MIKKLFILLVLLLPLKANADITMPSGMFFDSKERSLYIERLTITPMLMIEFNLLLAGNSVDRVFLSSPGGLMDAAIGMSRTVRDKGVTVIVNDLCASACTLLALASPYLIINQGGALMFHSAYYPAVLPDKTLEAYGQAYATANIDLHLFLIELGYNDRFVRYLLGMTTSCKFATTHSVKDVEKLRKKMIPLKEDDRCQ